MVAIAASTLPRESSARIPLRKRRAAILLFAALIGCQGVVTPAMAAHRSAHPDFRGLWQMASADLVVKPGDDPTNYTVAAAEALARYKRDYDTLRDQPQNFCVPHGMPWIMVSRARDYLIDIDQTDSRITMLLEGLDMHRLIYFHEPKVPAEFRPSTFGYSRAHWDSDTLVIETTHLKATNPAGPFQRSDQARVTERWHIVQDPKFGRALAIDLVEEDPIVFQHPAPAHQLLIPAEPGSALNAYGCTESLWDDHIRTVKPRGQTAPPAP